jgi:hypothetical protein
MMLANAATSTTITYPGPLTSPGLFVSGQWNYVMTHGISVFGSTGVLYAANYIPVNAYWAGFDLTNLGVVGQQVGNVCLAMRPPAGWLTTADTQVFAGTNPDDPSSGGWTFEKCGTTGPISSVGNSGISAVARIAMTPFARYAGLGNSSYEGEEYSITNATTQASFGGTVIAGGSNHYKVRFDGTNWTRVA